MATKILLLRNTAAPVSPGAVIQTIDGAQYLTPPEGLKWTIVEIRIGLSAAGEWKAFFDTEKYWNGRQELDFIAKQRQHTVTIDLVQPHFIQFKAQSDAATIAVNIEVVIEESPQTA